MTVAYFDSSAIVKLMLDEDESAELRAYATAITTRWTSALSLTEVVRAARRHDDELAVIARVALRPFNLVTVKNVVLERAARLEPSILRTLDAIHLATAFEVEPIDAFVTYDRTLAGAARALGFAVEAPA